MHKFTYTLMHAHTHARTYRQTFSLHHRKYNDAEPDYDDDEDESGDDSDSGSKTAKNKMANMGGDKAKSARGTRGPPQDDDDQEYVPESRMKGGLSQGGRDRQAPPERFVDPRGSRNDRGNDSGSLRDRADRQLEPRGNVRGEGSFDRRANVDSRRDDGRRDDDRRAESRRDDDRRDDRRRDDTRRDDSRRDERRRDDTVRDDSRRDDGRRDEGRRDDGRRVDSRRDEGRRDEGRFDERRDAARLGATGASKPARATESTRDNARLSPVDLDRVPARKMKNVDGDEEDEDDDLKAHENAENDFAKWKQLKANSIGGIKPPQSSIRVQDDKSPKKTTDNKPLEKIERTKATLSVDSNKVHKSEGAMKISSGSAPTRTAKEIDDGVVLLEKSEKGLDPKLLEMLDDSWKEGLVGFDPEAGKEVKRFMMSLMFLPAYVFHVMLDCVAMRGCASRGECDCSCVYVSTRE
jgi:hypothetical protein